MFTIELDESNKKVTFRGDWSIEDPLLFELITREGTGPKRIAFLERAIKLGAYTLSISDVQVGLLGVVKDLDAKLVHLKHAFDVRAIRDESAGRGTIAEVSLLEHFEHLFADTDDSIEPTGATIGKLAQRKVGDFVIHLAGTDRVIALESKFDKAKTRGTVEAPKEEHAVGQLLLSSANRDAHYAIFIAEEGSAAAKAVKGGIEFDPELAGFLVVVNPKTNDYAMLDTAIELARCLTLALDISPETYQHVLFSSALLISEAGKLTDISKTLDGMRKSANSISEAADSLEKSIESGIERIREISEFLNGIGKADISEQQLRVKRLELAMKKLYHQK